MGLQRSKIPTVNVILMTAMIFGLLNLVWEVAQLPFYTLWVQGTLGGIAFAIAHCTAGDMLIGITAAGISVMLTRFSMRGQSYSGAHFLIVFMVLGLSYTVFSEWLNVHIRRSWAYSETMPTVPPLGTGLTPLMQWLIVPLATFAIVSWTARRFRA